MKTLILAVMYAAIVTQSEGCDVIKDLTGREWHDLPTGTKAFLIVAAIWGAGILILIGDYLTTKHDDEG
jgi:Ni/Fe-hydrogenase subunit HybB-like protein